MNKAKEMQIEKAIAFLLNKAQIRPMEALQFTEVFPEWTPSGIYSMNSYVTYGVDENGNRQLYHVDAPIDESNKRVPGNEPDVGSRHYTPIQDPTIGKDDE